MSTIPEITDFAIRHGYNPIPPRNPQAPFSSQDIARIRLHEAFQRQRLRGFTIRELQDIGCWDKADAVQSDLDAKNSPIHPLFQRERWRDSDEPIDFGSHPGNWEAKNDAIWNILLPSLRIATRLLHSSHNWPWLDALIYGQWLLLNGEEVNDGCPPGHVFYDARSFHTRDHIVAARDIEGRRAVAQSFYKYFSLGITANPRNSDCHAYCSSVFDKSSPRIYTHSIITFLAITIRPLLRDDLIESERLVHQFSVAVTLLHETLHGLGAFVADQIKQIAGGPAEPFFENEEQTEAGWSWENAVFGGIVEEGYRGLSEQSIRASGEPHQCFYVGEWPNWREYADGIWDPKASATRYRTTDIYQTGSTFHIWPIQIKLIEDLQQESYWTIVARFGLEAFRTPKILGLRRTRGSDSTIHLGRDYISWADINGKVITNPSGLDPPNNATEFQIWEAERQRGIRALAIQVASRIDWEVRFAAYKNSRDTQAVRDQRVRQQAQKLADERDVIQAAISAYDPYDEEPCVRLLSTIASSTSPITRSHYFMYTMLIELAGNAEWRRLQMVRGRQERRLITAEESAQICANVKIIQDRIDAKVTRDRQIAQTKRRRGDDGDDEDDGNVPKIPRTADGGDTGV